MSTTHHWLSGGRRPDRAAALDALSHDLRLPPPLVPVLDAHRRLRGPFTAAGTLLRAIVPDVLESAPDLVRRYDTEILSAAPELRAVVPATRETLTSLAVPAERTRYYSQLRARRIAHGLLEFVRDAAAALGPRTIVVENVEHADHSDHELFAAMLRRIDPAALTLVLCTGTDTPPDGPLPEPLARHPEHHRVTPARRAAPPADATSLAEAYVDGDCVSDDEHLIAAYRALDEDARRALHDRRATDLEARDEESLGYGAIPFHREHGTDPTGAGAAALQAAVDHCSLLGFYHATIELARRTLALVGWDQPARRYLDITSRLTTALAVLERPHEAEDLYDDARLHCALPMVHMGAAYATGMLYTRHFEPEHRDHRLARRLVNQSIAFASQLADEKDRAFQGVFMRNGLALVAVHQGDLMEALELVSEGVEALDAILGPDEHRLHRSVLRYNRGQVYANLGRLDEAVTEYTAVIELDPNYPEYHFDRGNLLRALGRDDEALADWETAVRLSPPFHEAYYNRGDLRAERGDIAGALADFDYVLELDPEYLDAYVNRAGLRLAIGDESGARADADAGLALDPENPHLRTVLGQLLAAGDPHAARAEYDRALAADPDLVPALAARAAVATDTATALADLTRALDLMPDDPALRYNRAMLSSQDGSLAAALSDLDVALTLAPDDEDIQTARAECASRLAAA